MSTLGLHSGNNLKQVLFRLPKGMPMTTRQLAEWGISRQLAHRYIQNGWLELLGYGYYLRTGDILTDKGAVAALEANGVRVHIGGKSALALKGFAHYLSLGGEKIYLYGKGVRSLPAWFTEKFDPVLTTGQLFAEGDSLQERLCVGPLEENDPHSPVVSEPERAVLELLDLVPKQQTLAEARQIIEGLYSLRSKKMQHLLERCKKVKVKRLFWELAGELKLPVLERIDTSAIDFGAAANYILAGEKTLALKNPVRSTDG